MEIKILVALVLVITLIAGNALYPTMAQTATTTFLLQFMTVPQKLIHETDANLLIYAVDSTGNPLPIKIPTVSVTSSDPSVVTIKDVSSNEFDNSVRVDIHAGKIGSATVTAAANGFLSSTVTLEVVGDAYKPEGLIVKAVPSSFAHFGPHRGHVSVQLINFFGNPLPANEDIVINLSSSDPSVVNLNKQVIIKKGENFIVNEFTVIGSGITLLHAEVPGKWKESVKITVTQPKMPLQLKFYVAPQIAPSSQGQLIYGFAQLQDANGVPVKADRDISVNMISDSQDIRGGFGVVKKGSTTGVVKLTVNTNLSCKQTEEKLEKEHFDKTQQTIDIVLDRAPNNSNFYPCVELVAVAKGFKSQSVFIELRAPVSKLDLNPNTRIDDPNYDQIDPVFFPALIDPASSQTNIEPVVNMPILADGTEQPIGVVQLMKFVDTDNDGKIDLAGSKPVIPFTDVPLIVESDDVFKVETKSAVIAKGDSSSLIRASIGYEGGETQIASVAEFFGQTFTKFTLHGHTGLLLAAEPLISKIMAKSDFPYIVYLKNSESIAAYSIGDMKLSLSKADKPEAEIGTSQTTTEILEIESGMIRKGSSASILQATSIGKGTSTLTVEGSIKDLLLSTTNEITMSSQLPEKLGFFIPSIVLGNAKYTVPLQVLDKDGFPIKTISDAEILFVPSLRNVISAPASIMLPQGEYYATLLIEAKDDGTTEVTALANNFQSTKLDVQVTAPQPTVTLTPIAQTVKTNDEFTITVSSKYLETPLRDLNVKWSSDKAVLLEASEFTDELGMAEAKFIMRQESPFLVTAQISGPGYKTSSVTLDMQTTTSPVEIAGDEIQTEQKSGTGINDILLKNPHFLILPAIGGVIFWLVKTERISLPFDRLLERFRESEED